MSYIIDFCISCPQCFPEDSPRLHAQIHLAQGPGQAPAFSLPSGCPRYHVCPSCDWCYRTIREMFFSGKVSFYNDPASVHGVFRATIPYPVRPR